MRNALNLFRLRIGVKYVAYGAILGDSSGFRRTDPVQEWDRHERPANDLLDFYELI